MPFFSKRLKWAREQAGLTQEGLGRLAGIDEASASPRMNQYEKGKYFPNLSVLKKIAGVVNLPVSFFYAEKDIEAELILRFHRMSEEDKKKVLEFVNQIKKGS
jgi:transcriptional regulator with XRE-family HTH domain